jgi:hypothetical protein
MKTRHAKPKITAAAAHARAAAAIAATDRERARRAYDRHQAEAPGCTCAAVCQPWRLALAASAAPIVPAAPKRAARSAAPVQKRTCRQCGQPNDRAGLFCRTCLTTPYRSHDDD